MPTLEFCIGIGGAVNLIMKDAPSERQFTVNLSTGYNAMYFDRTPASSVMRLANECRPEW